MLSVHSLRNHCSYALYHSWFQWFDQNQLDHPSPVTRQDCTLSLKLDPANSLQPGQNLATQYNCAIAHQLASDYSIDPETLAADLCRIWGNAQREATPVLNDDAASEQLVMAIEMSASPRGWITIEVGWPDLLAWLTAIAPELAAQIQAVLRTNLADLNLIDTASLQVVQQRLSSKQVTTWQYTHARCCSLLRQADQLQIVTLVQPQAAPGDEMTAIKPFSGVITSPASCPWQALMTANPRCVAAERELLLQLITITDTLVTPLPPSYVQRFLPNQIQGLCNGFTRFHQTCRILEAVQEGQRELAQARLGLISLTQQCLQVLMEDGLGLSTPTIL